MPILRDSIDIKTVVPYPKKEKAADTSFVAVTEQRKALEANPLHTPSYDIFLLSSLIASAVLLFFIHIYVKNENDSQSVLSNYFKIGKREEGQLHLKASSVLQHLLSFFTFSSICYYLITKQTSLSGWEAMLCATVGIGVFIFSRIALIMFSGYLVGKHKIGASHLGIVRFLNKLLGLFLIPSLAIALLIPQKAYTFIIFYIIVLLLSKVIAQLIFVYKLLMSQKFSAFHSFLYLCTLEVLPIIYTILIVGFLMNK